MIGTAVINDYDLLFKGSRTGAYLTIEPKEGGEVPVAVWEVTESDEAALDRYEGYPMFYYKKEMELDIRGIRTGKIRRRKCFVYIMHEERRSEYLPFRISAHASRVPQSGQISVLPSAIERAGVLP